MVTANAGLDFIETRNILGNSDRDASLSLGGGVIYPTGGPLALVGELNLQSKFDFVLLSGGVDYKLRGPQRLRGMLGVGLDNGAPDWLFGVSFLRSFAGR